MNSSMMFSHKDGKLPKSHLRSFVILVFHLLLTHLSRGRCHLIGSSQPIVAMLGDDVILPCHMEPVEDASYFTLEWTKPDLDRRFVCVWRSGEELVGKKHEQFKGRTSLFPDELKLGNISLKLSKVKLADQGTYRCFIPLRGEQTFVQLVVGSDALSSPVITLAGLDRSSGGVILNCESNGWYPQPEVSWLDAEENVLPAGLTETFGGPDGLYTVSSRVTVEKRHNNTFICRVQQRSINRTTETEIHILDDFFEVQSCSSAVTVGLAFGLAACILLILLLVFSLWKKNRIGYGADRKCGLSACMSNRSNRNQADEGEKNHSKTEKTKDPSKDKGEREPLKTAETEQVKVLKRDDSKKCGSPMNSQTDDISSASQSSTAAPVIEVDREGRFIRLKNTSSEEQQLGGWKLEIQINNRESFTYTFEESFKLSPKMNLTLWAQGRDHSRRSMHLEWKDLKSWRPGDTIQVVLSSNTRETKSTQFKLV